MIRSVIQSSDIQYSFFSLDQTGNIIVADYEGHRIKIFSNSGHLIHTISNYNITEDQKLYHLTGLSVDKQNCRSSQEQEMQSHSFLTHKLL